MSHGYHPPHHINRMSASKLRIAIVNPDKCKPRKCRQECKKRCPVVRQGKLCIEVGETSSIAAISESLCIGCGICVRECPFQAVAIINLPSTIDGETSHRYGPNSFKLFRLPMPRPGQVLGLIGTNGIGKSTALKILAGKLQPNLGRFADPPSWAEVIKSYRGSDLQSYLSGVSAGKLKVALKPQLVDQIPKVVSGTLNQLLLTRADECKVAEISTSLDLTHLRDRSIDVLSGGELQRFAIAMTSIQDASVYMFDEPSSYLDVKQRLQAARVIRSKASLGASSANQTYVIAVEHDLAVLDYLSDFVSVFYGTPGAYGVVTMPFSVREGINVFLAGFIPTENMRFRPDELTFRVSETAAEVEVDREAAIAHQYPAVRKEAGDFRLQIEAGSFCTSEIIVLLGENGTGKTTFVRTLVESLAPLSVSYKPQKIAPKFAGTVQELLFNKARSQMTNPQFLSDVVRPLAVESLYDQLVTNLSGGELQRVAIVLALGKPSDVYLIDEPSAYLDSEQRIICGKVIRRFILHTGKTAFVVEHDFIMATYLADRVVVFDGTPGVSCRATPPQSLLRGMNSFLGALGVTFRRDPTNSRPRINKAGSVKDVEQKRSGQYFFMERDDEDEE